MAILMAGIDHTRAALDVRSVFSFTKKMTEDASRRLMEMPGIKGCVILSTCNRMELWLSTERGAEPDPVGLLCDYLHVDAEMYRELFTVRKGEEAVTHLFRLSAGLESMIIGEDQIITQVGDAVALARSLYATDHALEVLFRLAVTGGKKVKTEVDLSTADSSVIHTALRVLGLQGISVSGKKCMVIGNGMMGKLSAQTLMEHGADVTVTIRQYHSGVVDVPQGCHRVNYEDKLAVLPECDFVVSATTSPNYTLRKNELEPLVMDHPVCLIDLAVPRDIEQSIQTLPWATLYDIDSFHIDRKSGKLRKNLEKAEVILQEEEKEFYEWYGGQDIVPRIQKLREVTAVDVGGRMTPVMKKIALEDVQKQKLEKEIEGASGRMMNRLLFGMRSRLTEEVFAECLRAMEETMDINAVPGPAAAK